MEQRDAMVNAYSSQEKEMNRVLMTHSLESIPTTVRAGAGGPIIRLKLVRIRALTANQMSLDGVSGSPAVSSLWTSPACLLQYAHLLQKAASGSNRLISAVEKTADGDLWESRKQRRCSRSLCYRSVSAPLSALPLPLWNVTTVTAANRHRTCGQWIRCFEI